jgi:cytosine/adenosine deaminase-related metal-dependent hydrolase
MYAPVVEHLRRLVADRGGFVNAHSHLDIAYVLDLPILRDRLERRTGGSPDRVGELPLRVKIDELDLLLRESDEFINSVDARMRQALDSFTQAGVRACRTCVTVGTELSTVSLETAARLRDTADSGCPIRIVALPLRGLDTDAERDHFAAMCASPLVDVVGGLLQNHRGDPDAYLDLLFDIAGHAGKPLEVHVDEYLSADERESATLARAAKRARAAGYRHSVCGVHAVTLGTLPAEERRATAAALAEADVAIVVCPRAGLSMLALEVATYAHNSLAPVRDLLAEGVVVALGTDNIRDVFHPFSDGSMLSEIEMLAEATRYYDLDILADIASTAGASALGLPALAETTGTA